MTIQISAENISMDIERILVAILADNAAMRASITAMLADITAMRAKILVLTAKLDLDATVTDTNYASLANPAALTTAAITAATVTV